MTSVALRRQSGEESPSESPSSPIMSFSTPSCVTSWLPWLSRRSSLESSSSRRRVSSLVVFPPLGGERSVAARLSSSDGPSPGFFSRSAATRAAAEMSARRETTSSSRSVSLPRPQLCGGSPIRQLTQKSVLKTTSGCGSARSRVSEPTSATGRYAESADSSRAISGWDSGAVDRTSRMRQRHVFCCASVAMAMTTSEKTCPRWSCPTPRRARSNSAASDPSAAGSVLTSARTSASGFGY